MSVVADHWDELVTAALLGTDRRDPPAPPPGPLADAVADAAATTASALMLDAVAACTAVRRAAFRPRPPAAPLSAAEPDGRPWVSPAAGRRWRSVVAHWPVLEDEWLAVVDQRQLRLPPDVLVGLLRRHHDDGARRALVMRIGDPLAGWLVGQRPELGPTGRRRRPATGPADTALPALAVPPALVALLEGPPDVVVTAVVAGVRDGSYAAAHRAVLVNFVARMRADVCHPLAEGLRSSHAHDRAVALAHLLADLAETRHLMREELT